MRSVHTTDRGHDSPIQNDKAWLIRCLLYGKREKFNSYNVAGSVIAGIFLESGDFDSTKVCSLYC